jgi:hypothetical protein
MKKLLAAVAICLMMAGSALAANVVQMGKGFIYVKLDGTNSFNFATSTFTTGANAGVKVATVFPQGLALTAIVYAAPAASAVLVVRTEGTAGPIITQMTGQAAETYAKYYPGDWLYKPYLTHADQTTDTDAVIWFEFSNKPM